MKKKELGASIRHGLVAGTIAGCIAGWGAFALHSRPTVADAVAPTPATTSPAVSLPPVPGLPALGALPGVGTPQITTSVAVPAFQPLPPLPARLAAPSTTTRTS
ncbi:MAG: hypothetical protein ACYC9W_09265 [Candidatus Limnocylindria bacterium]